MFVPVVLTLAASLAAQDARSRQFTQSRAQLAEALRRGDEQAVLKISGGMKSALGQQAGVPETPDEFRPARATARPLTRDECRDGAALYLREIQRKKWWAIGLDPTRSEHLPREAANVIVCGTSIVAAGLDQGQQWLALARDVGDYLLWTQRQGGAGVFPFPHYVGGRGRAFESATRLYQRAEKDGTLDKLLRNGWAIDDMGDGGLQFDNGLCGVAILELYQATREPRYLQAVEAAADWAVRQPPVPNWNYNAFSVYLLAKAARAAGQPRYLESAKLKARLGVYPGQLTDGPRGGRWADPHNARPAYHYILVRGIAALAAALDANDPERPAAIACLRLALLARNGDFGEKGLTNKDSALEALLLLKTDARLHIAELEGCRTDEALGVLERAVRAEFRSGRLPLSPRVWGRFLEYENSLENP
jgi:hypothetical protein